MQPNCFSVQGGFSLSNPFSIFSIMSPQKLLFSWGPGSVGEQLAEGTGIKVERGHYILLQVRVHKRKTRSTKSWSSGGVQPRHRVPHRWQWHRPPVSQKIRSPPCWQASCHQCTWSKHWPWSKIWTWSNLCQSLNSLPFLLSFLSGRKHIYCLTRIDVSNMLLQVSLVNVTSIFLWGGPSTDAVKVWANVNHRLDHQHLL